MNQHWKLPSTKLRFLLIIVLILGIFFRFVNLDRKVYWQDEVATSLRISGSPLYQVYQQEFNGDVITVKELYKNIGYNSEKNIIDVIKALVGNPEHAPLYYLIARFWMQLFGYSVLVMRSLPALISLFSLPSIYWLCIELFESPLVGWVAVTLLSVSPFHVLYAQEARQYSLWILTILLSSAALLRAIRLNTKISWGIYAATLVAALYTHIFSGLVAIGHAIYMVITNQFRFDKKLANYCIAAIAGLLAFAPWAIILLHQRIAFRSNTAWTKENLGLIVTLKRWFLGLMSVFFDPNSSIFGDVDSGVDNPLTYWIRLPILILIGYSVYFICRHTSKRTYLFILTLIGMTALVIVLPSLILGTPVAGKMRYQPPFYLGIQLAVSYLLATQIASVSFLKGKIWQVIFAAVITSGIVSCAVSSQAQIWWNKEDSLRNLQVAQIINQANRPLLISNDWVSNIVSLSYMLDPKVSLQLVIDPNVPKVPEGFSDIFVFNSSEKLRNGLETEENYKVVPINPDYLHLWKLTQ